MNNIIDYTIEKLEVWMLENDESKFRAKQVISWIYKGVEDFEDMKNLPNERVLSNSVNETSLQNFKIVDNYGEIMVMTEEELALKNDYNNLAREELALGQATSAG